MINGKPYSFYGFVPISYHGFLDMPQRLGEVSYDWGDYVEPLLHEDDLFWKSRELRINVLYDARLSTMSFRSAIEHLTYIIGYFEIVTTYGTFNVKLKEVNKSRHYNDNNITLELVFEEETPVFKDTIPGAIGGNDITLDGYSLLNDFNVLVSLVKYNDNIAKLFQSNKTRYHPNRPLTDFREFKNIEIQCSIIKKDGYQDKLANLKKLLASPDYRYLVYKSTEYKCFITEGFRVDINKEYIQFLLRLNIFSQVGLFQEPLFGGGLFYYGNQRKYLESLFEYNLFESGIFKK